MRKNVARNFYGNPYFTAYFWSRVNKGGIDECWEWNGTTTHGYGHIQVRGKNARAPRVAWRILYGEIPHGLCVLHLCDTRACVNPTHLYLGTYRDNCWDRYEFPAIYQAMPHGVLASASQMEEYLARRRNHGRLLTTVSESVGDRR